MGQRGEEQRLFGVAKVHLRHHRIDNDFPCVTISRMRGTFVPEVLVVGLLTLPWLNPFSVGPSPAIPALIFSWWCAAALVLIATVGSPKYGIRWDKTLAVAWIVAATLSVLAGLFQYFGVSEFAGHWINSAAKGVAYGNLRQRNQFATLTSIGVCALLFWAPSRIGTRLWRWAVHGLVALLALGNAASASRTGLTQLVLLTVLAGMWSFATVNGTANQRNLVTRLAVIWAAYALGSWALPRLGGLDPEATGILGRIYADAPICSSRITLWGNVVHLIAQKPWLGWGWGNLDYAHFVALYPAERFCDLLDNAHNLPLHLAVELGVPVAVGVCGLIVWLLVRAKPWHETRYAQQTAWSVLAVVGLHSLLEYPLWYGPFQLAVVASLSMLWPAAVTEGLERGAKDYLSIRQRATSAVFATGMLSACAYAAWDYWRVSQLYLPVAERHAAYREDTLEKVRSTWLFQGQVLFAELTTTPLTRATAESVHATAFQLLHFSPEPRVVEKLIESAVMLDRDDEALFYLLRYKAAYPQEHAQWATPSASHKTP
jgi:O-antigen ligase